LKVLVAEFAQQDEYLSLDFRMYHLANMKDFRPL
jgi:hypothetical protein